MKNLFIVLFVVAVVAFGFYLGSTKPAVDGYKSGNSSFNVAAK